MRDWMRFGRKTSPDDLALEPLNAFLSEYRNSGDQSLYAIKLWGIEAAFKEIFGGLTGFSFCEPAKRSKYLQMLGAHALRDLQQGDLIAASCNKFYLNYLSVVSSMTDSAQTGQVEQITDMLSGIIRYGGSKMKEMEKLENEVAQAASGPSIFKVGSGSIEGLVTERTVQEVSKLIISDLQKVLTTREDYYWFMIEFHDLLLNQKAAIRDLLDTLPLFPIEYEGMRSADSYVGKPNPGVEYMESIRPEIIHWCRVTIPSLDAAQMATRIVGVAYGNLRMAGKLALDAIRLEYAVHYHNNCVSSGNFQSAERWNEVINSLS